MTPFKFARNAIRADSDLVQVTVPSGGRSLPLTIRAVTAGVELSQWLRDHADTARAHLRTHGAILFRGFAEIGADRLAEVIRTISGDPLSYRERSSPRTELHDRIYTSTEYPSDQPIFPHCENSYQDVWPRKIFFLCVVPASSGGETPIADTRRILARLRPETRQAFSEKGVMYVRNYGDRFGLPWQKVFGTTEPAEVAEYCALHGLKLEWKEGGRLRTVRVAPAVRTHPDTQEAVWFNHAAFFHVTTLPTILQKELSSSFGAMDLPSNTFYGDGSPIGAETLAEIRAAYEEELALWSWKRGDLLMADNMLVAHGRRPYEGSRQILVGMSEPHSDPSAEPR